MSDQGQRVTKTEFKPWGTSFPHFASRFLQLEGDKGLAWVRVSSSTKILPLALCLVSIPWSN